MSEENRTSYRLAGTILLRRTAYDNIICPSRCLPTCPDIKVSNRVVIGILGRTLQLY